MTVYDAEVELVTVTMSACASTCTSDSFAMLAAQLPVSRSGILGLRERSACDGDLPRAPTLERLHCFRADAACGEHEGFTGERSPKTSPARSTVTLAMLIWS